MEEHNSFELTIEGRETTVLAGNRVLPIRNLSFEDFSEVAEDSSIKVYLRVRPTENKERNYLIRESCIQMISNTKECAKSFLFSHVFSDTARQNNVYDVCVRSLVEQFIKGNNSSIMTYGTSGAGKTYTLLGSITSPGIVPRVLFNIFKMLPMAPDTILLRPNEQLDIISLNSKTMAEEFRNKARLLKLCERKRRKSLSSYSSMQNLLQQQNDTVDFCADTHYTIWVSFTEIYNECVYDLLDSTPLKIGKERTKLKLCENKFADCYVKGLTKVPIRNGDEAYRILKYGQENMQYAATKLNQSSSRSHCIFTLYLIKSEGDIATLSHFNFCDLAGSERVMHTQHTGKRLKEAQNINSSLHVLGRCLKTIKENQSLDENKKKMVPYRESKLTKLFHRALLGHERLSLVVNINPKQAFFDETMNTLNFASIAKEIILDKNHCDRKSKVRISTCFNPPPTISSTMNCMAVSSGSDEDKCSDELFSDDEENTYTKEQLFQMIEERDTKLLEMELERERSKFECEEREQKIREELVDKFSKMLTEVREKNKKRMEEREKEMREEMEKRIQAVRDAYEQDECEQEESEDESDSSNSDIEIVTNVSIS